jgi:integrase
MSLKRTKRRLVSEATQQTYESVLRAGVADDRLTEAVAGWSHSRMIQLQAAINWTYDRGALTERVAQNLIDAIPLAARAPRVVDDTPSMAQADKLESAINHLRFPKRELMLLPMFLALRVSEMLNLSRADVQAAVETGQLRLLRKGNEEHIIPCGPSVTLLKPLLAHPFPWATLGELMRGKATGSTRRNKFWRWVKGVGVNVQLNIHPHTFRHICATRLYANGVDIRSIQEFLNHKDIKTTMRYLRVDMEGVARGLGSPPAPPKQRGRPRKTEET